MNSGLDEACALLDEFEKNIWIMIMVKHLFLEVRGNARLGIQ